MVRGRDNRSKGRGEGTKVQRGEGEGQRVKRERGKNKGSKGRGIKAQNAMCASIKHAARNIHEVQYSCHSGSSIVHYTM